MQHYSPSSRLSSQQSILGKYSAGLFRWNGLQSFRFILGSLKLLSFIFLQNLIRLLRRLQSIFSVSRPLPFFLAIMFSLSPENFILNMMFSSWNLRIRKQNNYHGSPLFKKLPKFLSRNLLYVPGKSQLKSMNEAIFILFKNLSEAL